MGGGSSAYDVLHVSTTATQCEIRAAYKKQCLLTHPDKSRGGARSGAEFAAVQRAYAEVKEGCARKRHDEREKGKRGRCVVTEVVELSEMECEGELWWRECRCGGSCEISRADVEMGLGDGVEVVCSGCSLGIRVVDGSTGSSVE